MTTTGSTLSQTLLALIIGVAVVGSGCSRKKEKAEVTGIDATVDATQSSIEASGGPVVADGVATATVTVTFLDVAGLPVPGVTPQISATPATGVSIAACPPSDATGVSVCTLSSTVAETKTVNLAYPIQKVGNTVVFDPGPAARLCFITQPGGGQAGVAWSQQPSVHVGDANCNLINSATNSVSMSLQTGSGALGGSVSLNAVAGVATFTNLSLNVSGTDKVLRASAAGLTAADSSAFTITGGAATAIIFATQPGGGSSNSVWAQQPTVHLLDQYSNLASTSSDTVFLSVQAGTGTLSGGLSRNASGGVASFSGLRMNAIGTKSLRATSIVGSSTLSVVSSNFDILPGAPFRLAFSTQPGGGSLGAVWPQQPVVQVQDQQGNVISTASNAVSLQLIQGTGSLGGVATVTASSGVASFTGLSLDQPGSDKILRATSGTLSSADSDVFSIAAGGPSRLCFTNQPGNSLAGNSLTAQPVVVVGDTLCGTVVSATGTVSLAISSGTGSLLGTVEAPVISGVAAFSGLSVDLIGTKNLGANYSGPLPGIAGATSNAFIISAGAANKLVYISQPSSGTAAVALSQQPSIQIQDFYGNVVSSSASVTLSLGSLSTGSISGTATIPASSGLATFSGLSIDFIGNKTLVASSGTLITATSNSFNIALGPPSRLVFNQEPSASSVAGAVWAQQPVVRILDAGGNLVTSSSATVSLSVLSPATGSVGGTSSLAAVSGVATYAGLSLDLIGNDKRLLASSAGLTSGTSGIFEITQGPPTRLCFQSQPGTGTAGVNFAVQPVVIVGDDGCNVITAASNTVTLALQSGSGTLSGSLTAAASSGIATFSGMNLLLSGVKVIRATSPGLTLADTSSFTINPGAATQLAFSTQPGNGTSTIALPQQPVVQVRDTYGNVVNSSSAAVSLAISSGTGVLSGTGTVAASSGVATFSGLSINLTGAKQLTASASGVSSAVSSSFNIAIGAPNRVVFSVQPGGGTAGVAWLQQPTVLVQDAGGNTVTASAATINLAVTTGSGSLFGTASRSAVAGVAAFTGLSMQSAGSDKVVTATSTGLTSAVSTPAFVIVPGVPSASISTFTANPTTIFASGTHTSTLTGTVLDAYGNPIAGRSVNVSSSRGATDSFVGTTAVSNAAGVVSYTLSSSTVGSGSMTISIPANSVTVTQRPVITFESYVATLAQSSWSVAPVTVAANGSATATVNVVLRNINGTALPGKNVTVVSSRGGTDTVTTSPSVTDASGAVAITVRSSTRGEPNLTIASSSDSLNLTTLGRVVFYDVGPIADWQSRLANSSAVSMGPGLNAPSTTTWKDLFNLGPNDGTLTNFGFTATSGWCGNGGTTITGCADGPYRLVLDGTNDHVGFGSGVNSAANRTHEVWARSAAPTARGQVILGNGDEVNNGLTLRTAWDGSGKIELTAGSVYSYPGMVFSMGATGYWRLNEPVGSTTGTANIGANGTYVTIGTLGSPSGLNDGQTSVYFNGTNSNVNMGNVHNNIGTFSVAAMVYRTGGVGVRNIVSKGSNTTGYAFKLSNGQLQFHSRSTATQTVSATGTLAFNTWYHVVAVRDSVGGTLKVFINGVEAGSAVASGAAADSGNNLFIGKRASINSEYWQGRLDEVSYFPRALTATEVSLLYSASQQHTCYSTAAIPANNWRHLAASFNDTSQDMSLYVNGTLNCTRSATGYSVGSSANPLGAGAALTSGGAGSAPYFNGMLGDIRVYDQALSGTQILNNFNATSPRFP